MALSKATQSAFKCELSEGSSEAFQLALRLQNVFLPWPPEQSLLLLGLWEKRKYSFVSPPDTESFPTRLKTCKCAREGIMHGSCC